MSQLADKRNGEREESLGGVWSGSGEFGVSICEDRVLVGLELGYFTGKAKHEFDANEKARYGVPFTINWVNGSYVVADGKHKNLFAAVNVTLRRNVGERSFLYGGVGAGMARSDVGELNAKWDDAGVWITGKINFEARWRLLGQAFAGAGIYLNDNWSLTVGYRLRYLAGDVDGVSDFRGGVKWDWKVKQNLIHVAEVGLTYQW
jgi:opacity protein-like surface antigen